MGKWLHSTTRWTSHGTWNIKRKKEKLIATFLLLFYTNIFYILPTEKGFDSFGPLPNRLHDVLYLNRSNTTCGVVVRTLTQTLRKLPQFPFPSRYPPIISINNNHFKLYHLTISRGHPGWNRGQSDLMQSDALPALSYAPCYVMNWCYKNQNDVGNKNYKINMLALYNLAPWHDHLLSSRNVFWKR